MKKYKLIKRYPGSAEVGTEVTKQENGLYISSIHRHFGFGIIENNPDFWEEVKEKEWEILEFKFTEDIVFKLRKNGDYWFKDNTNSDGVSLDAMLNIGRSVKSGDFSIHSIKRLSDGEVFTVGDAIRSPNVLESNEATIRSFELRGDSVLVKTNWHLLGIDLRNAKKIEKKEPILTTEDGVHLYEGDKYWTVFTKASSEIKAFTLYGPHKLKRLDTEIEEESFDFANCKYFAESGIAIKFIEESRPKVMYGVNESFTKTAESSDDVKKAYPAGDWKWFSSEKERDLYVEENKPRFSKTEMRDFYIYTKMNGTPNFDTLLSQWINRKEK